MGQSHPELRERHIRRRGRFPRRAKGVQDPAAPIEMKEHSRGFGHVFLNRPGVGIWSMFSQLPICDIRFRQTVSAERQPTSIFTISLVPSTSRGRVIVSAVALLPSLQIRICVLQYSCSTVIPLAVPSILFPPSFHWGGGFLLHSPQLTVTHRAPSWRLWVGCASAYYLQQLHYFCNYWRE